MTANIEKPIRVVLVDDHAVVREGTRSLLSRASDIELVAETESGLEAIALVEKHEPDVVLLDIKLKERNGVETARELRARFPSVKIIALTAYGFEPYVKAMMKVGVEGYLLKDSSSEQIIDGIRAVNHGGYIFTSTVAERMAQGYINRGEIRGKRNSLDELTERETEVLKFLAEGKKNVEISGELHLSVSTVEAHVTNILGKLGARSRTEAVGKAVRRGLVVLDP
jgi:DNA-binding NarL/FixJ family response regulator